MDIAYQEPPLHDAPRESAGIALLRAEHAVILGVVDAVLRAAARRLQIADAGFWRDVVAFFRGFVDGCHHAKEEAVLLPRLVGCGFRRTGEPLAAVYAEHAQGRALVASLAELRPSLVAGDPEVCAAFLGAVREYCALMVRHVRLEDELVLPLAERVLGADAKREIVRWFPPGGGDAAVRHGQLLALADRIRRAV